MNKQILMRDNRVLGVYELDLELPIDASLHKVAAAIAKIVPDSGMRYVISMWDHCGELIRTVNGEYVGNYRGYFWWRAENELIATVYTPDIDTDMVGQTLLDAWYFWKIRPAPTGIKVEKPAAKEQPPIYM